MKTVSGEVVSSEPVSLSKAARILSKFVSLDSNGASPAFVAYLRRASASFDELAQLHKEHKKSGSHSRVKKQHFDGVDMEETAGSVRKYGAVGVLGKEVDATSKRKELRGVDKSEGEGVRINVSLNGDEETRRHKSKSRRDEDEGRCNAVSMEVQKVEGVVDRNAGDVGGTGKKSKKKKENNEIVAVTVKDEPYGDHDTVDASELKNGAETFDGSKETEKKKKRAKHDVAADIVKQEQSSYLSQNDGNETGKKHGDKQKKHKKNQPHGDHDAAVNAIEVNNETESFDGNKERKKKKKRDKPEKEKSDDLVDIKKEMQSRPSSQDGVNGEASQLVENNGNKLKKCKKSKKQNETTEERVNNVIKGDEQREESKEEYGNTQSIIKVGEEKRHKKKRTHEEKERANEDKIETEAVNNKESRKRKHESVASVELEGSQEKHKSKKKKR